MAYDDDEPKLSKFNAGLLQMKRIADLQERINNVSLNPLSKNEEIGVYNYEIWTTSCDSLFQEINPKLNAKEREHIKKVREAVHNFLNDNPIFKEIKSANGEIRYEVRKYTWMVAYRALNLYEEYIRHLLEVHEFNSPGRDDSGL